MRRKMDFTEQQLSQINLKSLDQYKDFIINEFQQLITKKNQGQPAKNALSSEQNKIIDFVLSSKEIICCKKLVENKQLFKNA